MRNFNLVTLFPSQAPGLSPQNIRPEPRSTPSDRVLPCHSTIQTNAADASMAAVGARIDPAQPLASVRGVCRKPASYSNEFRFVKNFRASKKAGVRIPAHFFENAGSPDSSSAYNFKCLLLPASCPRLPQPGVLQLGSLERRKPKAGSRAHFP
jgi:hypothetical protein